MLAVVEISKKQYLVQKGDVLKVQKLKEKEGKISFDKVLLLADDKKTRVGTPYVDKAKVEAQIEGEKKDKKINTYTNIIRLARQSTSKCKRKLSIKR